MNTVDVLFFAIIAFLALKITFSCPTECVCKWKNGKQSVECAEKGLTSLPIKLDSGTQVLDFNGNNLQVLQKEAFQSIGLINLQKIYLEHCRLHKIDNHAFKGLTNLVELDLSQNYLTVIPSPNFVYFPALMRLILNDNPITTIKSQSFHHLVYLTTLEISKCKIETIENEAFSGVSHLEWLKLHENKLTTIQGDSILPETLKGVSLHNNNWNCDCQLHDLYTWLRNFNLPQEIEPICSKPSRLAGKAIKSLDDVELACKPEATPTFLYIEIDEGKNITLECKVTAIPEAKISWLFQGQIIQNDSVVAPGLRLIYYIEEGTVNKKSDLYVYNTNIEDNGTFSCVAENQAGKSVSNYSVKITVNEEPIVIIVTFPYKYSVILISGGLIIGILLLTIITVAIISCKADLRRRKKKDSGKEVALQNQNGSTKNPTDSTNSMPSKQNGSIIIKSQSNNLSHYPMTVPREFIVNVSEGNIFSPNSLRPYCEKNPDLIHDAESLDKKRDGKSDNYCNFEVTNPMVDNFDDNSSSIPQNKTNQVKWKDQQPCNESIATLPRGINKNTKYQHSADVHLNPGCFLEADGYPTDFGLPKIICRPGLISMPAKAIPYYQTLPYNRNKFRRLPVQYAKDNEFNSSMCQNYEHYNPSDARYTADGYPFTRTPAQVTMVDNASVSYQDQIFVPSPPEGYKTENVSMCCVVPSGACTTAWVTESGQCIPIRPSSVTEVGMAAACYHIQTRCVNTQTTDIDPRPACDGENAMIKGREINSIPTVAQLANVRTEPENCTESPDEGYVGDGVIDPTDM